MDEAVHELDQLIDEDTRDEAMDLARFSCGQRNKWKQCKLFQVQGCLVVRFRRPEVEQARQGYLCLADCCSPKKERCASPSTSLSGFPWSLPRKSCASSRCSDWLRTVPGLLKNDSTPCAACRPLSYPEEDWQIVRACFTLLRHSAAELRVAFADAGAVDFPEVAQVALRVLRAKTACLANRLLKRADNIHHLLIDEFQDTSRRQHKLISALVAAWPDPAGRSLFVVGDPMQSIYFFRDADAELFSRVRTPDWNCPTATRCSWTSLRCPPTSAPLRSSSAN